MKFPQKPDNEIRRLDALRSYRILDTPPEEDFDAIVKVASYIAQVPIAYISLVDQDRQWFKSSQGLDSCETDREVSFCAHVVADSEPLTVTDTLEDERFHDHPSVVGGPKVRFYRGMPLITDGDLVLGTLCVADTRPRMLDEEAHAMLDRLAATVMRLIDARRDAVAISQSEHLFRRLTETSRDVRDIDEFIQQAIELACQRFRSNAGLVTEVKQDRAVIRCSAACDDMGLSPGTRIAPESALARLTTELARPAAFRDLEPDAVMDGLSQDGWSALSVRLRTTNGFVGNLILIAFGRIGTLSDLDREELTLVGQVMSSQIERSLRESERSELITTLEHRLTAIKTLEGLLPICSYCKQIRDENGTWHRLESFVSHHSKAQFSHGICPTCYPE